VLVRSFLIFVIALTVHRENGRGLPSNRRKAIKYYELAAAQGNSDGMKALGFCFQNSGEEGSREKAIEYYKQALALNHPEAMNNLAIFYQHGEGMRKNEIFALYLYRRAGLYNPSAQNNAQMLQRVVRLDSTSDRRK
jgi:TPR repeat protein